VQISTPAWAYSSEGAASEPWGSPTETRPVRPSLQRVFEDTENAGFEAQAGGRLSAYGLALADTSTSPLLGHGMGKLARVSWAWGGFRAHTAGSQPGVDNAFLTIGLKAGAIGIAAFAAMVLWPLRVVMAHRHLRRMRTWFVPAWLAILGLMLIQSFSVSGYAPFALSILLVLPALGVRRRRSSA
jgi:O-antigen ligase